MDVIIKFGHILYNSQVLYLLDIFNYFAPTSGGEG